ncbi:MAG: hypothetical protein CMN55_11060 [Sneathiella sp.]|jgi:biopolymer transport protein ExbD|uniref:ExbD/TolR family protein n=1 Tax=Sneathiella sp. TaxID=1964365 RepID=UPI000C486D84|nr:biopolymer transporter ExbD [Sneathiella sp.]MAL79631.1 hypothetical protein [Sneathiella sp.]|tara:strand:+ start:207 stop:608 length:402 start_codon:yes stop_codon:yes gene_type:complete
MKLKIRKKPSVLSENTIPLINVVFLMLIFFLIAGTIASPVSDGLIPAETRSLPPVPAKSDVVQIDKNGDIHYLGREVTIEDVLEIYPPNLKSEPVKIIADRVLAADRLIEILERFRTAGHEDIRLIAIKGAEE